MNPADPASRETRYWMDLGLPLILFGLVGFWLLLHVCGMLVGLIGGRTVKILVNNRSPQTIQEISFWDGDNGVEIGPIRPNSQISQTVWTHVQGSMSLNLWIAGNNSSETSSLPFNFDRASRGDVVRLEYDGHDVRILMKDH